MLKILRPALALFLLIAVASLASAAANDNDKVVEGDDDDDFEIVPFDDASEVLTDMDFRAYSPENPDNRTYGVIVDCGSSGTRAHLYEWDSSLSYEQLLHHIEPMRDSDHKPISKKFSPSLSSFAEEQNELVEAYIQRVLDYITEYIPRNKHPFTGIYILATAGMRLLDDDEQARIVDVVSSYIERNYKFAKVKTSVISGADEGMYQWISVNAKMKRFLGQNTNGRTKTFAVIEMGGASTQVTYQLRPGILEITSALLSSDEARYTYKHQIVEPQISRHDKPENTYLLHSTTFLGFGSNSAREAYLDLLIHKYKREHARPWNKFVRWSKGLFQGMFNQTKNQKPEKGSQFGGADRMLKLDDPCSPKGFVSGELKKPLKLLETKSGKILGYLFDEDEPSFSYKVRGTGSYNKCKSLVEEMLQLSKRERLNCKDNERSCTMNLIGESFIPYKSLDVLGIGDIFYTTNLMIRAPGTYNHRVITERTKSICNTPFEQLNRRFAYIKKDPKLSSRIFEECFKAVWVDTFLVKGLSVPTDFVSLKTIGEINNDDLEWTLGAVLDKSLAIEEATEEMFEQLMKSHSGINIPEDLPREQFDDNSPGNEEKEVDEPVESDESEE